MIIDLHCDLLYKLEQSKGLLNVENSRQLDANLNRLQEGNVKVQFFAIFVEKEGTIEERFKRAKRQINLFKKEILQKNPYIKQIINFNEIHCLKEDELGAVLTLEGVDVVGEDLERLQYFYDAGIRLIGLTWNHSNFAAGGVDERNGKGLSPLGLEIIRQNNKRNILTDVSHLSDKSFWDVLKEAKFPIASHSNARSVTPHKRNLTDEQIKALIQKDGLIHIAFYPKFLSVNKKATIESIIEHIDHIVQLGGINHIGFGSDFDGIDEHVKGLEHAGKYNYLIEKLLKTYTKEEVEGFMYRNFLNRYGKG